MQAAALAQASPPSSLVRAPRGLGTACRFQVRPSVQLSAVSWNRRPVPAKPIARQNAAVGQATSSRAENPAPGGFLAEMIRHDDPFQASARLADEPCGPIQVSPTNRQ